jgi:hypothetical protein
MSTRSTLGIMSVGSIVTTKATAITPITGYRTIREHPIIRINPAATSTSCPHVFHAK